MSYYFATSQAFSVKFSLLGHQKSQSRPSSATADAGVTASPSVHFIDEVLEGSEPQSDENQQPERARLFNVASGGGGLQRGSKQSREDGIRSNNDGEPLMSQQQGNLRPSDMELYAEDRAQIRITRTTDADARQEQVGRYKWRQTSKLVSKFNRSMLYLLEHFYAFACRYNPTKPISIPMPFYCTFLRAHLIRILFHFY